MRASEIPVGHMFYHRQLDKYGIVCFPHTDAKIGHKVVVWLDNFCAAPVDILDNYGIDCYEDLGLAPRFNITHKEVVKTVVKVEVIPL